MKHFTLTELTRSDTAAKYKIDNIPTPEAVIALNELVDKVLDPLREAWGGPIDVSSGYRCPKLNAHPKVKGAMGSNHLFGYAADLRIYRRDVNGQYIKDRNGHKIVDKVANRRLFELALKMGFTLDECFEENNWSWLHIAYRWDKPNRGKVGHLIKK